MVNYTVVKTDSAFDVVENQTGHVVSTSANAAHAKSTCRHLNFGGGFDGWTPGFFNENVKGLTYSEEDFYK